MSVTLSILYVTYSLCLVMSEKPEPDLFQLLLLVFNLSQPPLTAKYKRYCLQTVIHVTGLKRQK